MNRLSLLIILVFSSATNAADFGECVSKVSEITTGSMYGSMLRLENTACGNGGWICVQPQSTEELEVVTSNRVFSAALSAKAMQSNIQIRWLTDQNACKGSYPVVYDLRMQ